MYWSESLLKKLLWGGGSQFGLGKVHVLVWIHAFAQQKPSPFTAGLVPAHYFEGLRLVGLHQLVKGGQQELSDESQLVQGERDILLRVVWDASHPSLYLGDGLHQEVRVIAPQIVEDNRYGCGLRAQAQFQVARVMSGISVFSGDVTVVTDRVILKWFFTHITGGGSCYESASALMSSA